MLFFVNIETHNAFNLLREKAQQDTDMTKKLELKKLQAYYEKNAVAYDKYEAQLSELKWASRFLGYVCRWETNSQLTSLYFVDAKEFAVTVYDRKLDENGTFIQDVMRPENYIYNGGFICHRDNEWQLHT